MTEIVQLITHHLGLSVLVMFETGVAMKTGVIQGLTSINKSSLKIKITHYINHNTECHGGNTDIYIFIYIYIYLYLQLLSTRNMNTTKHEHQGKQGIIWMQNIDKSNKL